MAAGAFDEVDYERHLPGYVMQSGQRPMVLNVVGRALATRAIPLTGAISTRKIFASA